MRFPLANNRDEIAVTTRLHPDHAEDGAYGAAGVGSRARYPALLPAGPSWGFLAAGKDSKNKHRTSHWGTPSRDHHKATPGIVACTGAVVMASENSNPEARLTLKLKPEAWNQVLLPPSEQTTRQLQEVISQFNRTRDLLFVEARAPASATLQ
jgi:hypothetical protein